MDARQAQDCQTSYDLVADEYVRRIFDELQHKPLDRQLLDRFAASVRGVGPVCDVGCGPGHVARYLHEHGVHVCGVDLSPALVERARRLTPGVEFRQDDMMALDAPDGAWAGIVAFYSIIHIPRGDMARALGELRRVLRPGGMLLLAFHIGDDTIHLDEWWGQRVCVDFFFFRSDEVARYLREADFEIEEIIEREPYPDVEHQSRRAYIFARRPNGTTNDKAKRGMVPEVANLGIVRPPLVYLGALVLGLLLNFAWPVRVVSRTVSAPVGAAAVLVAMALFLYAVRTFRTAGTPVPGNRPTTRIVRTGPYRWSRNPIYLSFSLLQLGIAFWVNSLWLFVSLIPAVALMSFVVIPREEQYLETRFPADYPAYKASVRRWL